MNHVIGVTLGLGLVAVGLLIGLFRVQLAAFFKLGYQQTGPPGRFVASRARRSYLLYPAFGFGLMGLLVILGSIFFNPIIE